MVASVSTLLVAEPHPICRYAIRGLAGKAPSHLKIVGEGWGKEILPLATETRPTVILMYLDDLADVSMIRRLNQSVEEARIVVMVGAGDGRLVFEAIRAGVTGCLPEGASGDEILETIRAVAGGTTVFHPSLTAAALVWVARASAPRHDGRLRTLTRREREVLDLLTTGMSAQQIASRHGISRRTVEGHLVSVYRKLEVRGRIDAVITYSELRRDESDEELAQAWGGSRRA